MKLPQSEKTGGNGALLAVLVVASLLIMTVYFREGDTGPLHRVRSGTQTATAPVAAVGNWLMKPTVAVGNWFEGLTVSRSEAQTLKEQNDELRQRVAELEEDRLENERLRELIDFVEARELEALGACVIGRSTNSWEGVILIDRGSDDGVTTGMPILAPAGLLGQTIEVAAGSAKVQLITDQRSGVSAMIQATRATGVVNGSIKGHLTFDYASRESTVTEGDVVLTSGLGGVYPKGLLIGEVSSYELNENDLFPRISVRSLAQSEGVEEVIVLVDTAPEVDPGGTE